MSGTGEGITSETSFYDAVLEKEGDTIDDTDSEASTLGEVPEDLDLTPHLDRIAHESSTFTSAAGSPLLLNEASQAFEKKVEEQLARDMQAKFEATIFTNDGGFGVKRAAFATEQLYKKIVGALLKEATMSPSISSSALQSLTAAPIIPRSIMDHLVDLVGFRMGIAQRPKPVYSYLNVVPGEDGSPKKIRRKSRTQRAPITSFTHFVDVLKSGLHHIPVWQPNIKKHSLPDNPTPLHKVIAGCNFSLVKLAQCLEWYTTNINLCLPEGYLRFILAPPVCAYPSQKTGGQGNPVAATTAVHEMALPHHRPFKAPPQSCTGDPDGEQARLRHMCLSPRYTDSDARGVMHVKRIGRPTPENPTHILRSCLVPKVEDAVTAIVQPMTADDTGVPESLSMLRRANTPKKQTLKQLQDELKKPVLRKFKKPFTETLGLTADGKKKDGDDSHSSGTTRRDLLDKPLKAAAAAKEQTMSNLRATPTMRERVLTQPPEDFGAESSLGLITIDHSKAFETRESLGLQRREGEALEAWGKRLHCFYLRLFVSRGVQEPVTSDDRERWKRKWGFWWVAMDAYHEAVLEGPDRKAEKVKFEPGSVRRVHRNPPRPDSTFLETSQRKGCYYRPPESPVQLAKRQLGDSPLSSLTIRNTTEADSANVSFAMKQCVYVSSFSAGAGGVDVFGKPRSREPLPARRRKIAKPGCLAPFKLKAENSPAMVDSALRTATSAGKKKKGL